MIWVALAALTWVLVLIASLFVPVSLDEAWFLVVVRRVRGGCRLYRDVFYGVGPTPMWIARAAVALAGTELFVLRAVAALAAATMATAAAWLAHHEGAGVPAMVAVWLVAAFASGPASESMDNLYGALTRWGNGRRARAHRRGRW